MESLRKESPTIKLHRRQFFWQIILPLLVTLALLVTGGVSIAIGGASQARLWADISIIWLIIPALILALLGLVLLGFLVYAIARLLKAMPRFTAQVQDIAKKVSTGSRKVADETIKPILWVQQALAVWKTFLDALLRRS